ncbi:hypothetical protein H2200_002945 [Cladophialophora chaetospira]|uniref:CENP-T/Histone H4 histone fold domain-containing protein n=1 Tax=Cladophialophora chaetospira TaxID=386627 RepID=A0AA38XGH9_9EURO|nr:hypothetical protein H2200_002945 [Cladophialophora chaetospira]
MSSRKRPLTEIQNSHTPSRYAPSTPHAIRALQQRSGAKKRTIRKRAASDSVRPDSARGILRQLARLTAPTTKRIVPTPGTVKGKENREPDQDEDDRLGKRPRLTLDIDDSLESIEAPEVFEEYDEEDSEIPVAPTPSILPDDDQDPRGIEKDDPTFTLKSINYAADTRSPENDRRASRHSFPASDPVVYHDGGDDDTTFLSERGRRAPTQEPTEGISHYDFEEAFLDEEARQDQLKSPQRPQIDLEEDNVDFTPLEDGGGETEVLQHLQVSHRSPSFAAAEVSNLDIPTIDDSGFQLPDPELEATSHQLRADPTGKVADASLLEHSPNQADDVWESEVELEAQSDDEVEGGPDKEALAKASPEPQSIPAKSSRSSQNRRGKLKLTRHGEMVPSLPSSLIRRVVIEAQERLGNRKPKLGKDHMKALEQATEWFFEQVGEDLAAYSDHARRKKRIDRSDVLLLMRRQRILQGEGELLKAAKRFLPKEEVAKLNLEDSSAA